MFVGNILLWPPWWDWMLFIPSIAALLIVFAISRRSTLRQDNRHQWFSKLLGYKVMALCIIIAMLIFGAPASRDGAYYVVSLLIVALVATLVATRLVYLYLTSRP